MIYFIHFLVPLIIFYYFWRQDAGHISGGHLLLLALLLIVWGTAASVRINKRNFHKYYLANITGIVLAFVLWRWSNLSSPEVLQNALDSFGGVLFYLLLIPFIGLGLGYIMRQPDKYGVEHTTAIDNIWKEEPVLLEKNGVTLVGGNLPGLKQEETAINLVLTDRSLIIMDSEFREQARMPRKSIEVREVVSVNPELVWSKDDAIKGTPRIMISNEKGSVLISGIKNSDAFTKALQVHT
jgi:hypothetical protein